MTDEKWISIALLMTLAGCSIPNATQDGEEPCLYMSQIKDSKTLDNWHIYLRTNLEDHLLVGTEEPCPLLKSETKAGGLDRRKFGRVCANDFPDIIHATKRNSCPVASVVRVESKEDAELVARSRRMEYTVDFANRYAAAWNEGKPAEVASFFAEGGSYFANGRKRIIGRRRISAEVEAIIASIPDFRLELVRLEELDHNDYEFHWHLTGKSSNGDGNPIEIRGIEKWTFDGSRLIARSVRDYDNAEYDRQVYAGFDD